MKNIQKSSPQGQLVAVIVVSVLAIILIVGLSLKKKPRIVAVQAEAELTNTVDTSISQQPLQVYPPEIDGVFHQPGKLAVYAGNKLHTIGHDGAGWAEPVYEELDVKSLQLNCILLENDRVIIGGNKLFITGENYLEICSEYDFDSPVNVIIPFGEGYLAGTNNGLYFYTQDKEATIFKEDILVTALAEDVGGLWVGTFGDGLWRFDGEKWQRRYLIRDTSIFDFVNVLTFNYPFLWVGTPSGIFRYDGGGWKQLFVDDSSEVYEFNCFLPMVFKTYIGTQQGLFVFANDSLKIVPDFESMQVIGLFKDGGEIIVATRNSGIFKLKGKEEILRPEQLLISRPLVAEL
jgi:ligand-binding sensor domain-containing protein